jgi:hypothetical protein
MGILSSDEFRGGTTVKRVLVIVAVVAAALALASVAAAGDSVVAGHSPAPSAAAAGNLGKQASPGVKSSAPSGTLPFTGLDLAGIAVGGALLVGAGVIISRRTARRPQ